MGRMTNTPWNGNYRGIFMVKIIYDSVVLKSLHILLTLFAMLFHLSCFKCRESRLSSLKLISWNQTHYSQTSLIWTPKGQSEVSILERCPYKRGHYDSFKCSVAKTRLTLVFKLHLSLLIHSTKTLVFQ